MVRHKKCLHGEDMQLNDSCCSYCEKECGDINLSQNKDHPLWEFDGEAIHLECYIRLITENHVKKLLKSQAFMEEHHLFIKDIQERLERLKEKE